jgi:DNA topoisomerase-1
LDSADVNDYLRTLTGQDYTAKDFRTWAGTLLATMALQEFQSFQSATQAKKNIVRAIEAVASQLGNPPTICRKCYIHPHVINAYLDGTMVRALKRRAEKRLREDVHQLRPEEAAVLGLLQQRLQREANGNCRAAPHRNGKASKSQSKRNGTGARSRPATSRTRIGERLSRGATAQ